MTSLVDRPHIAASPDIVVFPGDPAWHVLQRELGLDGLRPAAVALPRTVADVTALVEHTRIVGLAIAAHRPGMPAEPLHGTVVVSLSLVAKDEIHAADRSLREVPGICDDPSNGEVWEGR